MFVHHRTLARRLALQALCILESVGDGFLAELGAFLRDDPVLDDLGIPAPPPDDVPQHAARLARETWARRTELDERLAARSAHWSVARMPPVDRNILRLGLYELLEERDTPPQVVLNEAVELARLFGDAESPKFVNGLLDTLHRELRGGSQSPPADSDRTETADGTV